MSQPDLESANMPSVINKKPQLNVYTVMLIVALVSLLLACLFLYLEILEYGGFGAAWGRVASLSHPVADRLTSLWA